VICLDELGPESAKSFPGEQVVRRTPDPTTGAVERAVQEIDYGRRGKGYVFGAFRPATGEAFTHAYGGRTIANWVEFLDRVEAWVPPDATRVYAILDNLNTHRATDVLLFILAHPRWEFIFQPTYAAYRNLIEPWWKTLRSLALKGLLERAPLSLRLGAPPATQTPSSLRPGPPPKCRMNLADAPLSTSR
jgi:hypothetical protein